jgi:uncharacterized integral membrane protein
VPVLTEMPIDAPAQSAPGDPPAGPAVAEPGPVASSLATPSLVTPGESRGARLTRHARQARLYASAGLIVALLAVLVILVSRNTTTAKLDWVVGSTHASVSWIVLAAAVFGWLLGITTSVVVRRRTRRVS